MDLLLEEVFLKKIIHLFSFSVKSPFEEKRLEPIQKGSRLGSLVRCWADPSSLSDGAVSSVRTKFQWFLPDETSLLDSIRAVSLANRVCIFIYALKYPDN